MTTGITFDTGALIALSRGKARMRTVWTLAVNRDVTITIPSVVVAEWYREDSPINRDILASCTVEPVSLNLARIAGKALAAVPRATVIDAIVVASAAQRGDLIYTSDPEDLEVLRSRFFRAVPRVFGV